MRAARARRVFVLVLPVLALAGCFGSDGDTETTRGPTSSRPPDPPGPGTTTAPPPARVDLLLDFAFEDCRSVHVRQDPGLDDVQALLPEGFVAREGELPGRGVLTTSFHACARYASASTTINDTFLGRVAIEVEPPEGFEVTASRHAYVLRMLAREDVFATVWQQAGYPVASGPANVTIGDLEVEASAAGYEALGATTPVPAEGGDHAFYHRVEAGHLVWTGSQGPWARSGTGTLTVPEDDPAAEAREGVPTLMAATGQAHADEDLWLDLRPWPA